MDNEEKRQKRKYKRKSKMRLDDIPSSNLKMEYYKKKRTRKRIKNTISKMHLLTKVFSILLVFLVCSKLMSSSLWFLPDNTFNEAQNNKHIIIIGNKITPSDRIMRVLSTLPTEKKPIYLINTSKYEKAIEQLSPVKKAFVRRYWLPARFEVTIEEQIPVLTIAPNPTAPEIAAITADGKIITKEYLPINSSKYKTYKILTYDDYSSWTPQEIVSLNILAERIENFSKEKLLYLDVRNKNDVYAQLETIKIRIGELNSTLKQRIERLTSIMPQIENLKRSTDYVDLRWENTTYLKKKSKNSISAPQITPAVNQEQKTDEQKKTLEPKEAIKNQVQKASNDSSTAKNNVQKTIEKPKSVAPVPKKVETNSDSEPIPQIHIEVVEP